MPLRVIASAQKISVANKRVHGRCARRNVVIISKMDHRPICGPRVDMATKAVWACVASLLLSMEAPPPALADAPAGNSQGAVLEELLKQQQEGKVRAITLKAAKTSAPVPAYEQAKSASKSTTNKSTAAASSQKQSSASKKSVQTQAPQSSKQGSRSLKFDGKATAGTQGSAPTGLELPVPKALAKSKVAPSTQTPSTIKRQETKVKPAPVTSKKPTTPKPAATAPQQKKSVAAPVRVVPVPIAPVPSPAPSTTVPTPAITSPLGNDAIQAGAVLTAEVLGLVIASGIVGQLTKPVKALKTTKA